MARVKARVGAGGRNAPDDVRLVQEALTRHSRWLGRVPAPQLTGIWDRPTANALAAFQREGAALKKPDGIVDPGSYTMTALEKPLIAGPTHRIFLGACWIHGPALGDADFEASARTLGCEVAAIKAIAKVETKRSAWFQIERPSILFEKHYFRDLTNGIYNRSHPDISGPQSYSGYGAYADQYDKLHRAAMLNEEAALKSASWGMFQIMGRYHVQAGSASIRAFVDAMMRGEREHLAAFVAFIRSNRTLLKALVDKKWARFAQIYNGPGYRTNHYDQQMEHEYNAIVGPAPAANATAPARAAGGRR